MTRDYDPDARFDALTSRMTVTEADAMRAAASVISGLAAADDGGRAHPDAELILQTLA